MDYVNVTNVEYLTHIREILFEFLKVKDEMLNEYGMVSVNEVLNEYLKRNPNEDKEYVTSIICNSVFH